MADYFYSDGNGNLYRLIGNQLSYEPVETIESSSGVYSGGKSFETTLSDEQVEELVTLFTAAFKNRTFRLDKRTLGSAEIRRIEEEETFKVIVAMRSPDKAKIETFLSRLSP